MSSHIPPNLTSVRCASKAPSLSLTMIQEQVEALLPLFSIPLPSPSSPALACGGSPWTPLQKSHDGHHEGRSFRGFRVKNLWKRHLQNSDPPAL